MRRIASTLCFALLTSSFMIAQQWHRPSPAEISTLPAWAQMMYAPAPNIWLVDSAFNAHYKQNRFEKNYHTQYYKRWRRAAEPHVQADGSIHWPDLMEKEASVATYLRKREALEAGARGAGWQVLGPQRMYDTGNALQAIQTNIYSLAQCAGTPAVMYAGTEPGEVYRSNDGGSTWFSISENTSIDGGVRALAVDPNNPDIVLAGAGWYIERSTNGGNTWTTALSATNLYPGEIQFHPTNSNIVLAATEAGLYRSTDGGASFTQISPNASWDVKFKPGSTSTAYLLQNNPSAIRAEFFVSTDTGATWTLHDNGWYSSSDPARTDGGGRIAVTPADSNYVYAYLIGEAKANDVGFIGVYKSTDGGDSWSLPNGPAGGPYTSSHPNLAIGTTTWLYHQGYYNCALMASNTNAEHILIGGLNLWRSDDGGVSFSSVSGYIGGPLNMHVDNQDFRVFGSEYWISTDGGIYRSTDFFNSQPTTSMDGIHGADFWGFGAGWNEDVLVGGLYHNGNNVWHEQYGSGTHLSLGGGEAPTGYVNPGNNRRTYFSDIGGRIVPLAIGQPVLSAAFGMAPNETYFSAESSELEFHPHCYNIAYLGRDHKLWRSEDGGGSFSLVDSFGTNSGSKVHYIEISRSNPDIIYISQQPASGNSGLLKKTTDGGQTWVNLPLPPASNRRKILIALDAEDPNTVFIAFPQSGNGTKVYKTTDSGTNWTNLTTSALDNESIHSIVLVGGTDGGLYVCTERTVYYRDNGMGNWVLYSQDLPIQFNTNIARAFYRDGKIRIASYGKGIWENSLYAQPSRPIATITVDQLGAVCEADSFHFEDYSMLNHTNASWAWTFQNGSPSSSTLRNPSVAFSGNGQHQVTLTVTDDNGQSDSDTIWVELTRVTNTSLSADFEAQFPPADWESAANGGLSWVQETAVGGYGASTSSAMCDNYYVDGLGTWTDLRAFVNLDSVLSARVTFDVAYAQYGGQYTDTLEVLVSTDCGQNFTQLYRKGGQGLATAPNFTSSHFVPTSNEWRTDTVDLSAYQGQTQVMVAFRCIGHYGQRMYLDNVNLNGTPIVGLEPAHAGAYAQLAPNPLAAGTPLRFRASTDERFSVRLYDLQGKLIRSTGLADGETMDTAGISAGAYVWEAHGSSLITRGKLSIVRATR